MRRCPQSIVDFEREYRGYTCRSLHFNAKRLRFGSTQLAPCVCLGACAIKQARIRTAINTEWLCRRTWVAALACCTHQKEKRQVGAQQDLAITCASYETCLFYAVVESVVEHMKKPLFECMVLTAQTIG